MEADCCGRNSGFSAAGRSHDGSWTTFDFHHPLWGWLFHVPVEETQVAEKPQPVLVNAPSHPAQTAATPLTISPPAVHIQPPIVAQGNSCLNAAPIDVVANRRPSEHTAIDNEYESQFVAGTWAARNCHKSN